MSLESLWDWLFPPPCPGCGQAGGPGLCEVCADRLQPVRLLLGGKLEALACGAYEGPWRRAILHFKKGLRTRLAAPMAEVLSQTCQGEWEALVPVPTPRSRRRFRGFNPVDLIARPLSRRLGLPLLESLECRGEAGPQKERDREHRAQGQRFQARGTVPGRILLVDDVITTGSTGLECQQRLMEAGARQVTLAALAWTPLRTGDGLSPGPACGSTRPSPPPGRETPA